MATLKDISEKSGVSISSVVRVLKGENVSEDIKRAVLKVKNELKYRMDLNIDDSIRYKIVVYVGNHFSRSFFVPTILEALKESAVQSGCLISTIILGNSDIIKQDGVDGVLAVATDIDEEERLNAMYSSQNIPILLVNRKCNFKNISYVTIDHYDAAYEAMNYLISLGHRKIAVVKGIDNLEPNIERYEGCVKALAENGIELKDNFVLNGNNAERQAYESVKRILANSPPTAVFALSDEMAIGTIKAIVDKGMKVPDDISVLGFDASNIFAFTNPSLTTIRVPGERMGQLTIQTIIRLIESSDILQQKTIIKHDLIVGNSTSRIKCAAY